MRTRFSLLSAAAVTFCSASVLADETPPTPPPGDTAALFEQAEQQMAAGDHAAAAATYRQLLDQLPLSARAQQAAFKAASCYEALGQPRDAVEMYERTVSIGRDLLKPRYYKIDGRKQNVPVGKPDSLRDRIERSLKRQAILCQTLGDTARGSQAIRYLAAFAPTSPTVAALIPLQLEFEGRPASEAADLVRQQEQAADLCRQAKELLSANGREPGIALLDRVLTEYPDTPASIRARTDKAGILWLAKRYEQSADLYKDILVRIGKVAPDVNAARTASYRLAWLDFGSRIKRAQREVSTGQPVSNDEWQAVRDACKVVMELDPDPLHRARANVTLLEAWVWQGRPEEVIAAANSFFRDYAASRGTKGLLVREICWARWFKAEALKQLSRPEEAAKEYRAILQAYADHSDILGKENFLVDHANARLAELSSG